MELQSQRVRTSRYSTVLALLALVAMATLIIIAGPA